MTYNADDDFVPPKKVYMDDILVTDPELGTVPFWRALLWNTAHLRETLTRADAIIDKQRRHHDDQPMKPTADPSELPPPVAADDYRADIVEQLEAKCDKLSARLDRLEKQRAAEQLLDDLETAIEQEEHTPPPEELTKH